MCVNGYLSRIRIGDILSNLFEINSGLKQGDVIAPVSFKIPLEKVKEPLK